MPEERADRIAETVEKNEKSIFRLFKVVRENLEKKILVEA